MSVVYLAGSLGGIATLAVLCAILFGIKRIAIPIPAALEAYLAQSVPGFRARAIVADGSTALVENHDGVIHLVVARGDCLVSRSLTHGIVRSVLRDGAILTLRLADFTLPAAQIALGDEENARRWQARL